MGTAISSPILIKKHNIQGISMLSPPLMQINLFHYLHKKNQSLIPRITVILEKMEKEGQIEKIREQTYAELLQ